MMTLSERAERTASVTDARVRTLQSAYRRDVSGAVSTLAQLRRGVGTEFGHNFTLMGIALDGVNDDLTAPRAAEAEGPSPEERAFFAALTLYATHQQSHRDKSMHQSGYSVGRSSRMLSSRYNVESTRARFTALGTAVTWDETLHHARGLIQQLRAAGVPLDYAAFARDLFDIQTGHADRVRLRWGRAFYRTPVTDDTTETAQA
ncbi:type I-E CRISPR-associated protein Cse2/CasB [Microbacterium sp.]|uniref:type I-E CRISPR-associated protein Cse2/CasB n=1 Tax=Microbacterium sp. TaxID=51671 RepID=UPI002615E943|nr:type I-E CRISPR-associated protein Cse2/CasB [Microbacterium sp.]